MNFIQEEMALTFRPIKLLARLQLIAMLSKHPIIIYRQKRMHVIALLR